MFWLMVLFLLWDVFVLFDSFRVLLIFYEFFRLRKLVLVDVLCEIRL